MASVVGQASAAATSVAIPAHAVGDLIIVAARGTAGAPAVPAAGGTVPAWATLQSGLANSVGLTVVAFSATATNHTTGAFTNATHICVLVLRAGANLKLQTAAVDSAVGNGNNTQTIIYPALTLNTLAGTSFGVRVGTRGVAITAVGTAPAGWTNQIIQPAGAAALMSVHTRAALTANPTADTVTVTSSNSAYRAVTVEVEEVPVLTDMGAVSVVGGPASVTAQMNKVVNFAATVARAAAVQAQAVVPVTLAAAIATNQPYAGEHTVGEFLVGTEDLLAVDLAIVRMDFLDGLIAGQAQVSAPLALTKGVEPAITGQSSVAVAQGVVRSLSASVAGAAVVAPGLGLIKKVAAVVAGQAALSADIERVPVTVSFSCAVAGAATVAPSLTVTNASYVGLDTFVAGAASVSAQTVETRAFVAPVSGVGAVAPSVTISSQSLVSFQALVVGKGDVAADTVRTRSFAAPVAGAGSVFVVPITIRLVLLECRIQTIIPICGENPVGVLAIGGPFIVGGASGPHAVVTAGTTRTLSWSVPIQGQAEIEALLRPSTAMAAAVEGQANVIAGGSKTHGFFVEVGGQAEVTSPMNGRYVFATQVVGKALIVAQMFPFWFPTEEESGGEWIPTDEDELVWPPTEQDEPAWTPTAAAPAGMTWIPTDKDQV